ncbi:MAG: hypothetical protein WBF33_31705 [Candidatus Nitrosopolaris sp.]|jgi:hypothetical protein
MEEALKSRGRNPVSEFFRWNNFSIMAGIPSAFDRDRLYTPTSETIFLLLNSLQQQDD